ncbi:MAG: glutamine-hydrolyzing GMP synthase [Opitutaceae bacterium]|jgi:GMP synthase (glutamine-hydrolysing)|nr:glutamine-hydrolyzing GMP synthase [Opitutaceae bacterium]
MSQTIAVLDFGSQYTQVIARRIRECQVYSRIYHFSTPAETLRADGVIGVVLSGGPSSVLAKDAPLPDRGVFDLGVPVLGICYGVQLMGRLLGGSVARSRVREFGLGSLTVRKGATSGSLFSGLSQKRFTVWNSHGDRLVDLPPGFRTVATTDDAPHAAIEDRRRRFYGIQFHPEVSHTENGLRILKNFLVGVCGARQDWTTEDFIRQAVDGIRAQVGGGRVLLALSGGVDSSVCAALVHRAVGKQLTCVYVDTGLMRKDESRYIEALYAKHFRIDLRVVDASRVFLRRLGGVTDPERKRKIIGHTFIEVFEGAVAREKKKKKGGGGGVFGFLGQGTIYPDVIESMAIGNNPAALIKSHHNVGGLPARMRLKLVEPLRQLFKDEVRAVGTRLGLPREVVWRQPFPGPGLAVRVIGEVTRERLDVLREADAILHEEMLKAGLYYRVWQSFCVYLPVKSVGVIGDERNYADVIALRLVESVDAMTADWARLPDSLLQRISSRITNEVRGVSRVVLDISSKPPATIEWE